MEPFNIQTQDIGAYAERFLVERGIDPDSVPPDEYTIADHLLSSTRTKLDMITEKVFRNPQVTDGRVAQWITRYLDDPAGSPNLFLRGGVGAGKTTNGYAALHTIALETARQGRRMTVAKISHADFNQAMRPQQDGSHHSALDEFQNVDLLMFDDLGAGQLTDWAEDTLYRLVDVRWSEQRTMIVTSNMSAPEMRSALDERIVSRLLGSVQIFLEEPDHRREGAA